jgi:hypothetical protein
MIASLLAADDGIFSGKFDLADICFLVAVIVFAIAFVIRLMLRPVPIDSVMIAVGLMFVAIGWLVL